MKIFFFFFSFLPVSLFVFLLSFFSKRSKDFIQMKRNVETILGLEKGSTASQRFINKNLTHFLKIFREISAFLSFRKKMTFQRQERFQKILQEAAREGQGSYLLVTAHLGAWDLLGYQCSLLHESPFHALAKPSRSKFMTKLLGFMRSGLGIKILWTGKGNFQKQLVKTLRSGGSVGFLVDQKPLNREGFEVNFLGKKTPFVKGPAFLAKRYKKPLVMAYCLRRGAFQYELVGKVITLSEIEVKNEQELTQVFSENISEMILNNPEQWVWSYKRWP